MIGVIADDLSGATELGGIGLSHGLRAEILVEGTYENSHSPGNLRADLICIDTDSRSCDVREAARRAQQAAAFLGNSGAQWIYKKVDSVLRGHVTAEIEAIMTEMRTVRSVLLPANPSRRRVIRNGHYFVADKPIHETEFARDPEHPRISSLIRAMVLEPAQIPLHVCTLRDSLPDSGIIIAEAQTSSDLRAWTTKLDSGSLAAGAAEFFATLLSTREKLSPTNHAHTTLTPATGKELFVCGSTSESAQRFLHAQQMAGVPAYSLPVELSLKPEFTSEMAVKLARQTALAFQKNRRVILHVGLPLITDTVQARQLAIYLVEVASGVLKSEKIDRVYAEGGATAVALVRRMGWSRLAMLQELAPGVTVAGLGENESMTLIVKPGSYEWPETVSRINF